MRIPLLIGSILLLGACAGASPRPDTDEAVAGRWQGIVLRNGLRAPVAVELSAQDRDWRGRLSEGDNSVPLQDVRVTATSVHFEVPGEGTFEGAVAGDSIAGSISGILLFVAALLLPQNLAVGLILAGVVSILLAGRFVPAFLKTGQAMPAGLMSVLSVLGVIVAIVAWIKK